VQEQRNKVEEVFDDIYVSFKIRVEVVSLILHGHDNCFNGVFGKNCRELLLKNMVNCGSTYMASEQFCAGSVLDPIFLNIAGLATRD